MHTEEREPWGRRNARMLGSVAVSAALLVVTYFLMGQADARSAMLDQLSRLKWPWLGAAVACGLANNVIATLRFRMIIRHFCGVPLPYWTVQKVNAAALFLGYWTPVSIAGDGGRMFWLRNGIVADYRRAFAIVLWDRVVALLALVAFMLPFSPDYVARIAAYFHLDWRIVAGSAVVIVAALLATLTLRSARRHLLTLGQMSTGELALHIALGALYVSTFVLVMAFAAAALDIATAWGPLFVDAPLLFLAQNVPVTFGGLGSREFGFLVMLGPVLGSTSAVAMSLVVGLSFLLASLPGGLVLGELTTLGSRPSV